MKKVFLLFTALTFALVSCNRTTPEETEGTVTVSVEYVNKLVTPEIAPADLTVTLTGPSTIERQMPEDGKLTEIPAGEYKLAITNKTEKQGPSFEPEYSFEETITVTGGKDTAVAAKMKQSSAGIYFVYEGTDGITPEATITAGSLKFEGADREAIGYFTPGATAVKATSGGQAVEINGQPELNITTEAGIHYEILLTQGQNGIVAVVYKYDTVTGNELGIDAPGELTVEFTRAAGVYYGPTGNGTGRFSITFTSDDGSAQFVMEAYTDMFADPDTFEPAAGTYSVSATEKLFGISAGKAQGEELANTYYMFSKESKTYSAVTIGEGDIILGAANGKYTMTANLKGTETLFGYDLGKISFSFEGAVEFTNEAPEIEFVEDTMPSIIANYYAPHRDYKNSLLRYEIINGSQAGYDCMMLELFVAEPGDDPVKALYEGVYRTSDSQVPMTIVPGYLDEDGNPQGSYSYKVLYSAGTDDPQEIVLMDAGTVVMRLSEPYNPEWRNQRYYMWVYGTGVRPETGERADIAYKAKKNLAIVDYTPGPDESYDITFTAAQSDYYGDFTSLGFSNATLIMSATVDNVKYTLSFDLYMENNGGELEIVPGRYAASVTREAGIFYKGYEDLDGLVMSSMTALNMNNWTMPISAGIRGGTLDVSKNGETYTFGIDVTGTNYVNNESHMTVKGSYEGKVTFRNKAGAPQNTVSRKNAPESR